MASIKKRDGVYQITVSMGTDYQGKKIRRYKTWTPPEGMSEKRQEKEVQKIAYEFENECGRTRYCDCDLTFHEFAEQWFRDYAEEHLREYTLTQYRGMMPRIYQAIGHIRLKDLRPRHLLDFYRNLEEKGVRLDTTYAPKMNFRKYLKEHGIKKTELARDAGIGISTVDSLCNGNHIARQSAEKVCKTLGLKMSKAFKAIEPGETLSGRTVNYYHRILSSILSAAEQWEAIESNPCRKIKAPKIRRTPPRYLDEEQAVELVRLVEKEDPKFRMITLLLLLTGMRREEAMGLEWKDIDFDRSLIHIMRTSQYVAHKGILTGDTKTISSERVIKVPQTLIEDLKYYREWQNKERDKVGDRWEDHDRLFTQWNGRPMSPQTYTSWFKKFIENTDLPKIVPHSLRHTNATLQIANNVPLTTVANRLGHATPATTTTVYSHAIKSADAAAAQILEDILHPGKYRTDHTE